MPLVALAAAIAVVLLQTAAAGAAGSGAPSAVRDRPDLRLRATNEWYGDGRIPLDSRSGPFSASYERFLERTAARERVSARAASRTAATPTWVSLGPTKATFATNGLTLNVTDSGRPQSIIVNGSTIYVASAMGGVWKSTDSGATWAPITDGLSTLSDGSLAMDPNNSSILYLGFGDPFDGTGIGLVKSTDGGATWSSPVFLGNETTIEQVLVDPSNSSIVLAATNDGLYRSTNAGASFSQVSIATGDTGITPRVWSIASTGAHSFALSLEGNPTAAYPATTDGQVWTSTNDGASWTRATGMTKVSGVGRITLASAPSNKSIVWAEGAIPNPSTASDLADIFKSTNGGQSWTALGVDGANKQFTNANSDDTNVGDLLGGQGWYNQLVAVAPTDPNTVYFGGSLALAKTTDGGSTFSLVSNWLGQFSLPYVHADFHTAAFDANGNLYVGTDGGISETTDGGTSFNGDINVGLVDHLVYSVGSSPNSTDAVIGGFQDLGTRLREGSTSTFDQVIGGDGIGSNVNRSNASLMLGSIYYDRILKSTNSGSSWSNAYNGISEANNPNAAPFFTRIVPWQGDSTGNTLYTFSNSKVYKTTNYATSWSPLPTVVTNSGVLREIGVAPNNANDVGAVASGGRVFLSANGGSTWTQAASPPNNDLSMSYISFDPAAANTIYVASVAPTQNASHLWKSTNDGASWTSIDGYGGSANGFPTGVPVNIVMVDPLSSSTIYAGTQLGLYRSTDGGSTWSRFGTGLPLVSVDDLYIAPDDSVIRAATYGRGFWELQSQSGGTHSLSVTKAGSGSGSVSSSPAGIDCGATCSASFASGTQVTLTATPGAGSAFTGWSGGGCSGTGTCRVTLNADTTVTADFTATHTLTVQTGAGTGTGSVSSNPAGIDCGATCSASFAEGTQVTLTATPDSGSTFAGWSGGGCSGTATCQVTVTGNTTVSATFTLKPKPVRCVVPNVKRKPLARAKAAIRHAHCSVGTVRKVVSKSVPKGRVISQRPKAGKHLKKGAKVNLVVSKGKR